MVKEAQAYIKIAEQVLWALQNFCQLSSELFEKLFCHYKILNLIAGTLFKWTTLEASTFNTVTNFFMYFQSYLKAQHISLFRDLFNEMSGFILPLFNKESNCKLPYENMNSFIHFLVLFSEKEDAACEMIMDLLPIADVITEALDQREDPQHI